MDNYFMELEFYVNYQLFNNMMHQLHIHQRLHYLYYIFHVIINEFNWHGQRDKVDSY